VKQEIEAENEKVGRGISAGGGGKLAILRLLSKNLEEENLEKENHYDES